MAAIFSSVVEALFKASRALADLAFPAAALFPPSLLPLPQPSMRRELINVAMATMPVPRPNAVRLFLDFEEIVI